MTSRPVWLLAVLVSLLVGCTRPEPTLLPPVVSPVVPVPPAPPEKTFVLSDLKLRYAEEGERLNISYAVLNRSGSYANAVLCFDFLDKDGYFVQSQAEIDSIGLSAGDSEVVSEDSSRISAEQWSATVALRVYLTRRSCLYMEPRADVHFVDKTGRPLETGEGPAFKETDSETDDPYGPSFELRDAKLVQNDLDEVMLSYTLTNIIKGRTSGQLCARLTREASCPCQGLESVESEAVEMSLGASKRYTLRIDLQDPENWARGQWLVLYMAPLGCMSPQEDASSNVLTLARSRSIHVPVRREPEPVDGDD